MDWKKLALGIGLAAAAAAIQFFASTPGPYQAIGIAALTLMAHFFPSSLPSKG